MKIHILNEILEYENKNDILDDVFQKIKDAVNSTGLIFSHLIIDGVEIYGDFYDYFLDNIRNIEKVKVITKTLKEISQEIIINTIDYLERAATEIEILSNEFYKTPSEASWQKLTDLLEGIKWIMDTFVAIDANGELKNIVNSYEGWNLYAKDIYSLQELMSDFEQILESSDYISTADILSYEISPLFKNMKEKLEKLVLKEVDSNALS